ncbi:PilZ domain-containing protein [Marinobacter sp.]|uniref:PilZ domain-containing protein n=1 Tax=Marinobacter sp. TaxID=50741 RepID=UPI003568D0B8
MEDKDYSFGADQVAPDGQDMREDYRLTARAIAKIQIESLEPHEGDDGSASFNTVSCEIRDISVRGMSLVSQQALNVDSILSAHVRLDSLSEPFHLMIEVIWCREDGRGYLMGVRVLDSDETDYLAWLDAVAQAFTDS